MGNTIHSQGQTIQALAQVVLELAADLAICQVRIDHAQAQGYTPASLPAEQVLKTSKQIIKDIQETRGQITPKAPALRLMGILNEQLIERRLQIQDERKPHAKAIRKPSNLMLRADLKYPEARLEALDRDDRRGINLGQLDALAPCTWLQHHQQVVIIGAPGSGKTWLACALGHAACLKGFRTRYYNLRTLLKELTNDAKSHHPGRLRTELLRQDLLIIDEFDPKGLTEQQYLWLLEVIDDRLERRSTLVASLKTPKEWAERIPDDQYAHMLVDRLSNTRYTFHLRGESRRVAIPDRESEHTKLETQPTSASETATRTCSPLPHTETSHPDKAPADALTALTPEEFERRLKPSPEVEDLARKHRENLTRSNTDKQ